MTVGDGIGNIEWLTKVRTLRGMVLKLTALMLSAATIACGMVVDAQADDLSMNSLKSLSIEELTNLQVTSVSKTAEPLSDAAAAIFVITREDIFNSGARSLPEILRLAPNLEVAQITSSTYAITAQIGRAHV